MNRILGGFALLLASGAFAADPAVGKTGLETGQKAPAFELEDQSGKKRSLSGLLEDGPVALVFFRSAKW